MIIPGAPDALAVPRSPTGLGGLNASPIEIAMSYQTILGRPADAAGMAFYAAQGDNLSLAALQAQLAASVEGQTSAAAQAAQTASAAQVAKLEAIAVAAPAITAAQNAIAAAKEIVNTGTVAQLQQATQTVNATVNAAQLAVANAVQTQINAGLLTTAEQAAAVENVVQGEVWQKALETNLFAEIAELQAIADTAAVDQAAIDAENQAAADEAERQRLAALTVQQRNVELGYDQLVRQAYKALGRETIGTRIDQIDQEGYDYWIGRLRGGMTQADFVAAFVAQAKANIAAKKAAAAAAAAAATATGQDPTIAANAILDSQDATKPGAYAGLVGTSSATTNTAAGGGIVPLLLAAGAYFLLGQ